MKLKDLLLDKLSRTKLFEMDMYRKDARNTVISLSPTIFDHLIKLFVMNLPQAKEHWIKELNEKFYVIDDILLKPKNYRLSAEEIYQWMIFDSAPHYSAEQIKERIAKMLRRDYKNVIIYDYNAEHVLNMILNIIQRIVKDIEKNTFDDVKHYLP